MNIARTTVSLLLLVALGTAAQAQSEKTREQVKAELAEAIRTGDVLANGESGLKLNELYPQRYPHVLAAVGATRAQVKAELAEAIRTGDMIATGETGMKLNEAFPQRYPTVAVAAGKTREQVKAELAEAIRTGDMVAAGESGLKLNQLYPQRYAKEPGTYTAQARSSSPAAAANAVH
jgi:ribosomal protein L30E